MSEFVHNDLKCNYGVLNQLLPCDSRFDKSDVFGKAKNAVPKLLHIKGHYKNSWIAPKLVDQTGRPSVESDVYSLDYLINTVSEL